MTSCHLGYEEYAAMRERARTAEARLERARPLLEAYIYALRLIAGRGCRSFTSGLGSCFSNGRTEDAEYGEDLACVGCVAWRALGGEIG